MLPQSTSDQGLAGSTSQLMGSETPPASSGASSKTSNSISVRELLDQQSSLESEAAEVLPFDCSRCTRSLGPLRQAIYSCLTCNPPGPVSDPTSQHVRAGVCSACSISCHGDHQLVELFVRRNFVCDCGTGRCNAQSCELRVESDEKPLIVESLGGDPAGPGVIEHVNKYDQNFDGQFCVCERGKKYDPETESEDMYQCLSCEDWRHASCLGPFPDPDSWDDLICAKCAVENKTLRTMLQKHAGGAGTGMMICGRADPEKKDSSVVWHGQLLSPSSLPGNRDDALASSPTLTSPEKPSQPDLSPLTLPTKRDHSELDDQSPPAKRSFLGDRPADCVATCTAPFKDEADSLLAKADPSTANVFMAAGWRDKWCKCLECFKTLSDINWLGAVEEEIWEPAEDQDSTKSLHELGMEAFKNLPQEQMIEGLHAYNKLRDHMMTFLKPFSDKGQIVTEEAIKDFFAGEREKIKKRAW